MRKRESVQHQTRMFVFFWITVFVSVRGSSADTGAPLWKNPYCLNGFCITLMDKPIRAEAGLCAVIPCNFTTGSGFTPQHIVWYKCGQNKERCGESDAIFNTDKTSENIKSGFKGRVSLLEPDVSKRNCSIMIYNLRTSNSGWYQLRVNGLLNGKTDGFTFIPKTNISVTDLKQKPTVMVPPLTEGQQTTLTCTAPGLCSGSHPKITWMWRGAGEQDVYIPGNITAVHTESLTAVSQRHNSSLTFNLSAEHHNTNVTCKISFTGSTPTKKTVTLQVNHVKEVKINGDRDAEEGKPLNLTCHVESFPPSLVSWTRSGTATYLTNDTLSVQQNKSPTCLEKERICSLFISNLTAEDSGLYICNVKYLDNTMTKEVNITVIYKRKVQISGRTTVKKGDALNLTCSVESFPSSLIMWTKQSSSTNLQSEIILFNDIGSATLFISNVTAEDSGQYVCTAKHLNTTVTEQTDVTVTYKRKVQISDRRTVKKGDALNLTCSIESFPPSLIMWTKQSSSTNLQNGIILFNDTGSATLFISNVTAEDSGQYVCTAKHLNTTVTEQTDVTVTWFSKILDGSGCVHQSVVLTCVCISEGFPLPSITWPLLQNHREYSVITMVSGYTVNSTVTLTVKHHDNMTIECVSSNSDGEAKQNFSIQQNIPEKEDEFRNILEKAPWLEIVIAFLIGVVLTASTCCLTMKCFRKQQKSSGNLDDTLEMVTRNDPLIYDGQAGEDQTCIQEVLENGAVVAEKSVSEPNSGPREVVYASIDFSLLKTKNPREARKEQNNTKTEYAEIKTERRENEEENGGKEGEILEDKEEEVMMEEGEEVQHFVTEEEKEAEEAVYSNVKDLMDEI